jgi:hypothetical protein
VWTGNSCSRQVFTSPNRQRGKLKLPVLAAISTQAATALLAAFMLAGPAAAQTAVDIPTSQPQNVGDLKQQARDYYNSGGYERDLAAVAGAAQAHVEQRAGEVARPALVLDIDETALSNWPELVANDFGYIRDGPCRLPNGPCGVLAWEQLGRATAIEPTLALFNAAKAKGVAVFFITGRDESEREATERNLRSAGYRDWTALVMRPVGTHTAALRSLAGSTRLGPADAAAFAQPAAGRDLCDRLRRAVHLHRHVHLRESAGRRSRRSSPPTCTRR